MMINRQKEDGLDVVREKLIAIMESTGSGLYSLNPKGKIIAIYRPRGNSRSSRTLDILIASILEKHAVSDLFGILVASSAKQENQVLKNILQGTNVRIAVDVGESTPDSTLALMNRLGIEIHDAYSIAGFDEASIENQRLRSEAAKVLEQPSRHLKNQAGKLGLLGFMKKKPMLNIPVQSPETIAQFIMMTQEQQIGVIKEMERNVESVHLLGSSDERDGHHE